MTATVSVLLPAFNSELTITRAIRSALAQTGVEVEICVVDDGSTDYTERAITSILDARIRYAYQPNGGLVSALNAALEMATGDYCIRLDADDWYHPHALINLTTAMDAGAGFAYGAVQYHGRRSDVFRPPIFAKEAFYQHNASLYPFMFKRALAPLYRVVCPTVVGLEDYDHVLQLIESGAVGVALPDTLVLHYVLAHGSMMETSRAGQDDLFAAFRELHPQVEAKAL